MGLSVQLKIAMAISSIPLVTVFPTGSSSSGAEQDTTTSTRPLQGPFSPPPLFTGRRRHRARVFLRGPHACTHPRVARPRTCTHPIHDYVLANGEWLALIAK